MLKALSDAGLTDQYEYYDAQFKELKLLHNNSYFINFVNKYWWNYGYDKFRVIPISLCLFIAFFIINIFIYKFLLQVYCPSSILEFESELEKEKMLYIRLNPSKVERGNLIFKIKRLPAIFAYTAFVFWKIGFETKELKLNYPLVVIIIFIEYLAGIICLAYLANYVLSK